MSIELFWGGFLGAASLGLVYVSLVLRHLGGREGARWIQHDPGLVLNMLLLTPLSVGVILAASDDAFERVPFESVAPLGVPVFVLLYPVLLAAGVYLAVRDVKRVPPTPVQLRRCGEALEFDRDKRRFARKDPVEARVAGKEYALRFPHFRNVRDLWNVRGSRPARVEFMFNIFSAAYLAFYFFWVCALIPQKDEWYVDELRLALLLVTVLMVSWFPLRLYSEWYRSFYVETKIESHPAMFVLAGLAVASFIALGFVLAPRELGEQVTLAIGFLVTLVTVLARINPRWFRWLAQVFEGMLFVNFVIFVGLLAIVTALIVYTHIAR